MSARKQLLLPMLLGERKPGPPRLHIPRTKGVPLEHDRPACPKCGPGFGAPISTVAEPGRWYGPRDATLWCPACGEGWKGSPAEVAQAQRAERAWERVEKGGRR